MANFICELEGNRGRNLKLYDTKIVIITKKSVGSLLSGNISDGEKTLYLCDIVGIQFKRSGLLIGYLQFETPSMQMNNKNDNFFSENTFTYEVGKNGITTELMEAFYNYITDRIEELKYGIKIINKTPNFESMKVYGKKSKQEKQNNNQDSEKNTNEQYEKNSIDESLDNIEYIDIICPGCGEILSFLTDETNLVCPYCEENIVIQ